LKYGIEYQTILGGLPGLGSRARWTEYGLRKEYCKFKGFIKDEGFFIDRLLNLKIKHFDTLNLPML
jgi:hypothetical protein